ncbi:hypothetical protein [Ethanoligenens harbinense]|uniref:Uncharacterized protein n=1 Tax=Ethanoligenens harbinense (strain DSM 18485 / JCM 12961 / CGMCC 1.5033 / YUAN-3) TaxID=663278 RepID=E6U640_ETHHY|nr:hypothetical protein [Ethanoligenens harbinense]ADU25719.1 hypothetical protein Ethha_0132 [Ethanoligenens harbinense YUAN-3]AVQ94890.1 hypothetical protein CXQ68_00665 [Ethanoligenens harbinense YUAN-3]AYF37581.1 hypothetical protein CXP51_00670 [Ethanoligenens harbinense]AYF40301.1 hypothetical protein CN246_00665 [Ethanoligenens harbinense]QCN91138.1 hypothetical protein DRA42_00680 [Ethanoligenens harbinense]
MWPFILRVWNVLVQCMWIEMVFAVIGVFIMMRGRLFLQPFWIVKELCTRPRKEPGNPPNDR